MSKIGKKPIIIPEGVEVKEANGFLEFRGVKGVLKVEIFPYIKTQIKERQIFFSPRNESEKTRINWGTIRSLANNAVIGVSKGFNKKLEIEGIGYRANMEGNTLVLNIGLSYPVKFIPPEGIDTSVEKNTIQISGIDKALVGRVAAQIRALKKPEPYKGKGIRYEGEVIRRKAGKKVAGTPK